MKLVVQNFKNGKLSVTDAPIPALQPGGVLVRATASLISAGTDRAVIGLAQKGYLGKAKARPDLVRKVIGKAKTEGLWNTFQAVQNRLSELLPLGYSLVGEAVGVGADVHDIKVGDRVACAGQGYAGHAEAVYVPKNLCVKVPNGLDEESAAYVTLGAIALHGVRQADQQLGATVLVVGLGLVGQITVQICRAAGHKVIGLDLDKRKNALAVEQGAAAALHPDDPNLGDTIAAATSGQGVDAVLITAASKDSGAIFDQVAALCRDRAKVVAVGDVKMDMSRRAFFEKELEVLQSRSYGPGRYDSNYEEKGQDYPIGYVRWTERRNLQSFLELMADGRIDISHLTTHRFPITEAEAAYDTATGANDGLAIGVLLQYPNEVTDSAPKAPAIKRAVPGKIGLGVIGAGRFAKGVLVPAFMGTNQFDLVNVASARGLSAVALKDKYNAQAATSDPDEIVNDDAVEAVVIATRHDSHAKYVIAALKQNKHVFVEKPLCLNREELAAIAEAAEASSGILTVGFNRRFSPCLKDVIKHFDGRGEPLAMSYRINAGRIPLEGPDGWLHDPAIGGGRIIGEACHFIDTLQAVTGARPVSVTANTVNPGRATLAGNDIATITIQFDDGSLGTIHYWSNGDASAPKERLEIYGSGRIAVLDNFRRLDLSANGRTKTHRSRNQQKGFAEEAQAFIKGCQSGTPPITVESLIDTTLVTFLATEDIGSLD
ncbi:MAG: Gfo/Idh/MocA family oxidoreductase [Rhodospirillales bacterium]|jgi:predicted dehydrogenase/threonine dehydrogenase-like Zn-dependent dehydrogenase|nr:Gfo/Idh/MocA family oxidoreductase [Rhodospirillales bacterium]MBT3906796.1 Gfo/Idh/MocA family oxidoreductase [Rhodospirillaceae bacterium]MBT5035840.1 Gfo/Idh/MocA family oxidoreductase [Rhodospirillaceae bacterium]MBT6221994.1 Gfo/Idh/MocA family oxidoreductase [Rhodospirillaceae bacterium]MBT6363156.1 Gfo/Idh/MocA family oxidoreductase [Rhodospirillaceae bacterium]